MTAILFGSGACLVGGLRRATEIGRLAFKADQRQTCLLYLVFPGLNLH